MSDILDGICGFCQKEITDKNYTFLEFPDNTVKPVHITHQGVEEEHKVQHPNQ